MPDDAVPLMPEVALDDKVAFLCRADSYRDGTQDVELRETRMSLVFMTATEVFKLKRPLRNAHVDLRSLPARAANCAMEVRLNGRLAPGVYRGVAALTVHRGRLAIDGDGAVVEWLVRMERLPAACMLDRLIADARLADRDVIALGRHLGDFFARQPPVQFGADRYVLQLREQIALSTGLLKQPGFGLSAAALAAVDRALNRFLDDHDHAARRAREGRIIEGHGDLRPEHVCLRTPPVVIDCLEFSRALRLLDPFDELAFLGLECARLGAAWAGPLLRGCVEARLNDAVPPRLSAFYTALRAWVRARMAAAHLLEPQPRTPLKWLPLAHAYVARAQRACAELD